MNKTPTLRGIVHGKTVELERAPGLPDGQTVMVSLEATPEPAENPAARLDAMHRAFGAWAEDAEELDAFVADLRVLRKLQRRDPSE